jgi:outer membrane protein assembly factor BamB
LLEPYGSREFWADEAVLHSIATLEPEAFIIGSEVHPWDGSPVQTLPSPGLHTEPEAQWIGRRQGHLWLVGAAVHPTRDPRRIDVALIDLREREVDDDIEEYTVLWSLTWSGSAGTAVCAPSGRVLVTALDRRLAVVGPGAAAPADEHDWPQPAIVMSGHTDVFVHSCSAVAPGFALLGTTHNENPAGPAVVVALDEDGRERWRASVPFTIDVDPRRPPHPPIDLGDGRVLVAGVGLACFVDGSLLWSRPSADPVGATVLGSKAIVAASGRRLEVLTHDGNVREVVDFPGDARTTTSPAVAPDGTLYVGTQEAAWAIR